MGARFSKNGEGSSHRLHSPHQTRSHSVGAPTDLSSSYEAACRADPTLNSFDTTLHERTSRLINNLAAGVQVHSLSFDSLQDVTESLLDMNQDVVKIILESKKDIWKNPDLFDLVNEYLNSSLHTLDFCTDLDRCLKRARDRQAMVQAALERFQEEQKQGNGEEMGTAYTETLQELKNFKAAGDPFTEEFFSLFQSVYRQQVAVFGKLQMKKRKLDKKLNNVKAWRKVSNILFVATFAAVVICSVVAAAVAAPPVVTALAAAASVPLGSMGKWFNSLWKKYENDLKEQGDLIGTMELGTYFAIKDLDTVRILVDKFEIEMDSMLKTAEFALRQDEALLLIVDEIKKKLSGFIKSIDDLSDHADKCSRDIRRARTVILHRIIKYPSSTN